MKSYEIWLKGGGNLSGTMSDEDAEELNRMKKTARGTIYHFTDGDGDEVVVDVDEIAVFAYRDDDVKKEIGFA